VSSLAPIALLLAFASGIEVSMASREARADGSSQTDPATAQVLFDEAKGMMTLGNFAAACPKLAESNRLDPGTGTLTALAVCHEAIGKTATAWAEFVQVVSDARQAGRMDREQFAQQHIAALEPNLAKLTIAIEPNVSSARGFEVRRDGQPIGQASWGAAVPMDPGEHIVEARAEGKKPWWVKVTFGKTMVLKTVTVPILEDVTDPTAAPAPWIVPNAAPPPVDSAAPAAPAAPPTNGFAGMSRSTQRTVAWALGGTGVAAAVIGIGFGVDAISKSNDVKSRCPGPCTDQNVIGENSAAKTSAVVADVAIVGALLTLGAGAALYFTAPEDAPAAKAAEPIAFRLVPAVSPRGGGVVLDARW
jgi:hypothetical protein